MLAISVRLLAEQCNSSFSHHFIYLGILEFLETDLKTDQNFLLLDLNRFGRVWKYCFRLSQIMDFNLRRRSRYYCQSAWHKLCLAFFRHKSFFLSRHFTSLSIPGGLFRRFSNLCGIYFVTVSRNRLFQRNQSSLTSFWVNGQRSALFNEFNKAFQSAREKS